MIFKTWLFRGSLIIAFQLMSGCVMPVDPSVEIEVHQTKGLVDFTFFIQRQNWWSKGMARVPTKVAVLTLRDSEQTVWAIRATSLDAGLEDIRYAVLPRGYEQLVPKSGSPPELKIGNGYEVTVSAGGHGFTTFVYDGR